MFDRIFLDARPREVHNTTTITEHRAPTDKSVQLLKEMEAAAVAKIIDSVRVSDMGFECVLQTQYDALNNGSIIYAIFSVNGNKLTAKYHINEFNETLESAAIGIQNQVALEIANLIAPAFRKIHRELRLKS